MRGRARNAEKGISAGEFRSLNAQTATARLIGTCTKIRSSPMTGKLLDA